jgi:hypothetical protein
MRLPRIRFTMRGMIGAVVVVAIGLGLVMANFRSLKRFRERVNRQDFCYSSLNNIAMALRTYSDINGHLPSPFVTDDQGHRAHSWRILALTQIGTVPQASNYDYAGRWDAASNGTLSAEGSGWMGCASEGRANPHGSPFVMINDLSGLEPSRVPSDAILVIEAWGANRNWLDPHDLVELSPRVRVAATDHPSGFGVILGNFRVTRVRDSGRVRKVGAFYVLDPE